MAETYTFWKYTDMLLKNNTPECNYITSSKACKSFSGPREMLVKNFDLLFKEDLHHQSEFCKHSLYLSI